MKLSLLIKTESMSRILKIFLGQKVFDFTRFEKIQRLPESKIYLGGPN